MEEEEEDGLGGQGGQTCMSLRTTASIVIITRQWHRHNAYSILLQLRGISTSIEGTALDLIEYTIIYLVPLWTYPR